MLSWRNRSKATNAQEAMEALADFFSVPMGHGEFDVGGSYDYMDEDEAEERDHKRKTEPLIEDLEGKMEEAAQYAEQHGIPFSRELMTKIALGMETTVGEKWRDSTCW